MPRIDEIVQASKTEITNTLHLLSACREGKALAEQLLERFLSYVWVLPASESHHHSGAAGLFKHSLEVALMALGKFEMGFVQEREPDGTLDVFSSHMNRPRWRYATLIAALTHDLGKLFDMEVKSGDRCDGLEIWDPFGEPLRDFCTRRPDYNITWRKDRKGELHVWMSLGLAAKILTRADVNYMGLDRWAKAIEAITPKQQPQSNPVTRYILESDHESAKDGLRAVSEMINDKVLHFMRAVKALVGSGTLKVNCQGAELYVSGSHAAVIVPAALVKVRTFLSGEQIALPENLALYNLLRDRGMVDANAQGRVVKKIKVGVGSWQPRNPLAAIILRAESLFSPAELAALRQDVRWEAIPEAEGSNGEDPSPSFHSLVGESSLERWSIG